jgi:hypothetical protein
LKNLGLSLGKLPFALKYFSSSMCKLFFKAHHLFFRELFTP